jgi:hypothetical protein
MVLVISIESLLYAASAWQAFRYRGPPVLFGRFWFTGTPAVLSRALLAWITAPLEWVIRLWRIDGMKERNCDPPTSIG